jgi:hypothetical protein
MKRKYALAITVTIILIGMSGVKTALGQRTVGVNICDWAEYTVFYSGNATFPPQLSLDLEWMKLTVEYISGTNITFVQIYHYTNGTEEGGINSVDVDTGQGHGTGMFIAKNLNESDLIYTSPPPSGPFNLNFGGLTINETISRLYLSETVETNHLNVTGSESIAEGNQTVSLNFYWYKATGALAEMSAYAVYQWDSGNTTWLEYGLVVSAMEVLPQRYTVGVKAGDWAGYDVSFEWSSNVPEQKPLSQFNISWMDVEVLDVQNSNVTTRSVTIYKNGTKKTFMDWVNVATGDGYFDTGFIPSNLGAGDRIPGGPKRFVWETLKLFINGTVTRNYAGANREVNYVDITYPIVYGNITHGAWNMSFHWDQKTGAMCEENISITLSYSVDSTNYSTNMSVTYRMMATNMWQAVFTVHDGYTFNITMTSNSTISNFNFTKSSMQIRFNVTGPTGTHGYCNVTIPKGLLQGSPWKVYVNSTDYTISCSITQNETHTFIYIPYTCSTNTIGIEGTWVIPEFPLAIIMPLFMIATSLAGIMYRKVHACRTNSTRIDHQKRRL